MIASCLTKHDWSTEPMWNLPFHGWWQIDGDVRIRQTTKVTDYDESDLMKMRQNDDDEMQ